MSAVRNLTNARYLVVSGYHSSPDYDWQPWFNKLWWQQNIKAIDPVKTVIISTTLGPSGADGQWLELGSNLGHGDDLLYKSSNLFMPGCPAVWMAGAWLAYSAQCDLLYLEQDMLAFGPWLDRLYQDLGCKKAIFGAGRLHKGSSTSLFLVRWDFIPEWCADYLAEGRENVYERLPERKWFRMAERKPEHYARLSFGFDTDRPLDIAQPVWYGQKFTRTEMLSMEKAGLIKCEGMPETALFSNHI